MARRTQLPIEITEQSVLVASSLTDDAVAPEGVTPLPATAFAGLRAYALDPAGGADWLTLFTRKGQEAIRIGPYVGLIQLADGTQLDILPKIGTPAQARSALLTMLRYLPNTPFRTLPMVPSGPGRLPLWDVFVLAFLDTLTTLSQQGLQRAYCPTEQNEPVWKGAFQAARHLRENAGHAERLALRYDQLTVDVPANRLLKTALLSVDGRLQGSPVRARVRQWLGWLDAVPPSASVAADGRACQRLGRLFARYGPALRWAEVLLGGMAFGAQRGTVDSPALLFPMARVFEAYVAHGVRTYWPDAGRVTVQESSAHLVDQHGGTPRFRLRPDLLIRQTDGRVLVLDTKWKALDSTDRRGTYGIDQADLYQLYAYGKKYGAAHLFLIYPASDTFREPLDLFGYDPDTHLHVLPFDPAQPLAAEVEKLAQYALSA